eukprot:m.27424 g.27424  ORF g.27424 m.27424 type:complete len:526 (-) comp7894_c0_seq3:160-1737(-)
MGPVVTPDGYNFTAIDSTWDYFVSLGVKPIVELSFMPAYLANCSWQGVNPTAPACKSMCFHYKGITQPPYQDKYDAWYKLVQTVVTHAVSRYGIDEISQWHFEVWNELWGMPYPNEYMRLYNASSHAVKSVNPKLMVGGPATAGLADVADFPKDARAMDAPFDFVSTHHYPSDPSCPKGENWDPDCFANNVLASRQSVAQEKFFLTEYNVGCCLGYSQHDTPAAAAFIYRQIGSLNEDLDVYSYWTFSDVFEEGGLPDTEFKNIYGSMTIHGIPKPAWRAFQMVNVHAGDTRLTTTLDQNSTTSKDEGSPTNCSMVPNTDFNGGDLLPNDQPLIVPNASACCQACKDHAGCDAWAYGSNESGCCKMRCYLKNYSDVGRKNSDKTFTSGFPGAPPPVPPKAYMSAFSTRNASATGLETTRVFLGFWGNPDKPVTPPANRSVTVNIGDIGSAQTPTEATLYRIGGGYADPQTAWIAMGSPKVPDADQLKELMQASLVHEETVPVAKDGNNAVVVVNMAVNSAVVVAF